MRTRIRTLEILLILLLLSTPALAQVDSDGDGVDDSADLCNGIDASFFDGDGDGCIDPTAHARQREFWDPADLPLLYVMHENGAPGIADGSDFTAIDDAFSAWTSLANVELSATNGGTTTDPAASGMDGINQITFEDPEFLAVYGSAVLAVGITTSYDVPTTLADGTVMRPGQIFDADMIFNPVRSFSTDSAGSGIDLMAVAVHEAGHLFGFAHSAVPSSTMFPALPSGTTARSLEAEDRLLAFMSYPEATALASASRLEGSLRDGADLSGVGGAAVFAISATTGDTIGLQYTLEDGSWQFTGLPDDNYIVAVAPLEGDAANGVVPGLVNSYVERIATNIVWPAESWNLAEGTDDDPALADPVSVGAGLTVSGIDILTNVDLIAPTLAEIAPTEGSPIRVDAVFFLRFDESMDFVSASTSLSLARVDGPRTELAFALVQVAEGDVFLIDPAAQLEYSASYELTVSGSISDRSGNPLGGDVLRNFTTEAAPALQISTVSPTSVVEGSVVVIYGQGFDVTNPAANLVSFDGQVVPASTASGNAISAAVPAGVPLGDFLLSVSRGAQTSVELQLTRVAPVDVVRGTDYATMNLAGVPATIGLLPDGNFAYVGTDAGISVATTALASPDFGTHTDLALADAIVGVAVAPDGRRVYAAAASGRVFVLDSDYGDLATPNATFNSILDELPLSAEAVGITVDAAGERAYVATSVGTIEVFDIEPGSATFHRQVGLFTSPVPSLTGALATDAGGINLHALAATGELLGFDLSDPAAAVRQDFVATDPRDLVLDPRGNVAWVSDGDGLISVVLLASGQVSQGIAVGGSPRGFTVDPTGARGWFADRANNAIGVIDLVSGSPSFRTVTSTINTGPQPVDVVALPDGLFVLAAEAGSRTLRLIGIGAGPELTGIEPVAGRPGDWFVISGRGFAPTGEGILSAIEYWLGGSEDMPYTRVWFGNESVRPVSATADRVSVRAPDDWNGEPIRVAYNGPPVQGQPTALLSNALTVQLLDAAPADLSETVDRAVFMGADNGYPWTGEGVAGTLAMSPTGGFALVVSATGHIYMIDADPRSPDRGQVLADMQPAAMPTAGLMEVSPDGRRAWFVADDNQIHELDTYTESPGFMQETGVLTHDDGTPTSFVPGDLRLTQSGNLLVVERMDGGGVCIFRVAGEQPHEGIEYPVFSEPDGVPSSLAIHPSGLWSVYSADDGRLHNVSLNTNRLVFGSQIFTRGISKGTPMGVAFTPDGSALVVVSWSSEDGGSYWLELRRPWLMSRFLLSGNALKQIATGTPMAPVTVEISPNGDRVVVDLPAVGETFYADVTYSHFARIDRIDPLGRTSTSPRMDIAFEPGGQGLYLAGQGDSGIELRDLANSTAGGFVSGLGQSGQAGQPLPAPVIFAVLDNQGQPAEGAVVEIVAEGGGSLGNGRAYQWLGSNADGVISIDWTLGPDVDPDPGVPGNNLRVTLNGGATQASDIEVPALEDPTQVPMNLVEQLPPDGTLDVSLTTTVQTRFSRAVDTATAQPPDFLLRRQDDQSMVAVSYGYADGDRRASMVPVVPLQPSTTYEVVVGASILDAEGGPLTNPVLSSFTTEPAPQLTLGSISPPAGIPGTEVTIAGIGFAADPAGNRVFFNGVEVPASGGSTDFLTAFVPVTATSGSVQVQTGATTSNTIGFAVLFPEPAPLDEIVTTVETGSPVQALAVSPDGTKAYSVNPQASSVVPIDMLTFSSGTPIPVGSSPTAVAIHPDGGTAYVTNYGSQSVSVISVASDTVIETITVGSNPTDIVTSPDGKWLYVVNSSDETLSVIDVDFSSAAYHTVVASAPSTKTTRGAAIRPDGSLLYLGTPDGFAIYNLDPAAYGVVTSVPSGKTTRGMAIRPDGSLLFLVSPDNEVLVIDLSPGSDNAVVATVATNVEATAAAISPDGTRLFLLEEGTAELSVYEIVVEYNVSATAVITSISVRTELINTVSLDPDPTVLAVDPSGSGIVVIGHETGDGQLTFLNGSSFERQEILADLLVSPDEFDAEFGGRGVVARICLPSGLDPGLIDVSSLQLATDAGTIVPLPTGTRVESLPDESGECLVLGFDRLQYQATVAPLILGRQIQPPEDMTTLALTGNYGAEATGFSATIFVDPGRGFVTSPSAGDGFWIGRPMRVSWLRPPGSPSGGVDLRFSIDGGMTWDVIALGLPDTEGEHWWSTRGDFTDDGLIEIVFRDPQGEVAGIAISEGFYVIDTQAVPVAMGEVAVEVQDGSGMLRWTVADAQTLDGFHVMRGASEEGSFERVSGELVKAQYGPDGALFVFADNSILGNRDYYYRLEEVRKEGDGYSHGPYRLNWRLRNTLQQNVPNVFNPRTTISFSIARDGPVRLAVYNLAGRLVDVIVDEARRANSYSEVWNGTDQRGRSVASGVYVYRLTAPGFSAAKKMTLVR